MRNILDVLEVVLGVAEEIKEKKDREVTQKGSKATPKKGQK